MNQAASLGRRMTQVVSFLTVLPRARSTSRLRACALTFLASSALIVKRFADPSFHSWGASFPVALVPGFGRSAPPAVAHHATRRRHVRASPSGLAARSSGATSPALPPPHDADDDRCTGDRSRSGTWLWRWRSSWSVRLAGRRRTTHVGGHVEDYRTASDGHQFGLCRSEE